MFFIERIKVNHYVDTFLQKLKKKKPMDYVSILKDMDIILKTNIEHCFKARI